MLGSLSLGDETLIPYAIRLFKSGKKDKFHIAGFLYLLHTLARFICTLRSDAGSREIAPVRSPDATDSRQYRVP